MENNDNKSKIQLEAEKRDKLRNDLLLVAELKQQISEVKRIKYSNGYIPTLFMLN